MQPLDFYAFARQVGGFTVLNGIRQHWRRGSYSYLDRPRPGYGIMLMIRGGIRFRTNEGELSAAAGDLLFLPKHSRYEALFENGTEDYLVNFELSEVSVATSEPTLLLQNASLEVFRRFDEMTDEARRSEASSLRCKAQLLVLLEEIVKNKIYDIFLCSM